MEIKINVDETKFKEVIEKELNAFSKEELHEIVRECIVDALKNNEELKKLFITRSNGSYFSHDEPSEILKIAAKNIDLSPAYKEIQESMIKELKENYHELLEKTMLGAIVNGIANDYDFRQRMANDVEYIIRSRNSK